MGFCLGVSFLVSVLRLDKNFSSNFGGCSFSHFETGNSFIFGMGGDSAGSFLHTFDHGEK